MKAYLVTTGIVFGLITFAHVWRIIADISRIAKEPLFLLLTIAAAALCIWAASLLKRMSRS